MTTDPPPEETPEEWAARHAQESADDWRYVRGQFPDDPDWMPNWRSA